MTALINASTSSGVVVTSDTSGSLAFQSNGTTIMTVASTGVSTQVGAPAFSAYSTTNQSISSATNTKVQFNLKSFDTANCYDTTNYRFYRVTLMIGPGYIKNFICIERLI